MTDPIDRGTPSGLDAQDASEPPVKVLTREQAQALVARNPSVSPWRAVAAQAAAGALCTVLAGAVTQHGAVAWSALYGAAAAVVPGAVMAHGMTRKSSSHSGAALAGFVFWEFVKIAVAVAMLVAAARVVPDLSWPALLVTMVVCLKVNWLVLLRGQRRPVVTRTQTRV